MKIKSNYGKLLFRLAIIFFCISSSKGWADSVAEENKTAEEKGTHAYLDIQFKNKYITPRGLLVIKDGLVVQAILGMSVDVYKSQNKNCLINSATAFVGIWNNAGVIQKDPFVGSWNEMDWWAGVNFTIAQDLTLSASYVQFLSPPHHFVPANNLDIVLTYNDSKWKLPVVFNPYLRLWYTLTGGSVVVTGRTKYTYYFELGATPTLDLTDRCFIPVVFSMPTYVQFGPGSFWNGGKTSLRHVHSRFGSFSTGLMANVPLKFIPSKFGNWYFDVGFQYYYLINENLLQAQKTTLGIRSLSHAYRNIICTYGGLGMKF